jgi:hypothetical protein
MPKLHAESGEPVGIRILRWLGFGKGRWIFIPFGLVYFGWLAGSSLIDHSWGWAVIPLVFFAFGVLLVVLNLRPNNRGLSSTDR